MQTKEQTLCSFCQNGTRLQLTRVMNLDEQQLKIGSIYATSETHQVRLNRKIVYKNKYEYEARKHFATYCQNIVLQLKLY